MSATATDAVWAARRSGVIEGGSTLLVALALADAHDGRRGGAEGNTRPLAALCGLSTHTVSTALKELRLAGVFDCTSVGGGRHGATYALAFRVDNAKPVVDNGLAFRDDNARDLPAFRVDNANVPRAYENPRAPVAKEYTHHPTGDDVCISGETLTAETPDFESVEHAEARDAALAQWRQSVSAVKAGRPVEPIPKADDGWPDEGEREWPAGVTRPEHVPDAVAAVRANLRPYRRRYTSDMPRGGDDER